MIRIEHRAPACLLVAVFACLFAPDSGAQATNPALRSSNTTPRFATLNRAAPAISERAASAFSPFTATCGDVQTAFMGAEVEPFIAINPLNPNNLVGAWQQDRHSNGASRGVVTGASFDGGVTWTIRSIPVSACTGGPHNRATDPWVSFSPDGTVHQVVLGVTGESFTATGVSEIIVSRSTDGGLNWSAPISLVRDGEGFFNDKEALTADPNDSRFVYAVWDRLRSAGGGPTLFARTTNGGVSWEAAREIFDPGASSQTIGNVIQVLPDGTLVNLMTILRPNSTTINVMRSTNRGETWSAPIQVSTLGALGARDPTTNTPIRDGSILPQMAAGPDGSLYIVWQDARFTQLRDAIAFSRSLDGGFTWSTPVRVNSNPNVIAFTPQVHVRADGVIGVTYYDLRSDTSAPATLPTDFWLARSADGGETWTETRVSSAFDLTFAPQAGGQYFLGDYTGLASTGSTFVAFYAKTNPTTANRTDIFAARVAPPLVTTQELQKRLPAEAREAEAYRAEPLGADLELDADFLDAVRRNVERALEARIPGWRRRMQPPSPGTPMR